MVKIAIPAPLRTWTEGRAAVEASSQTVSAAVAELVARFPGLEGQLLTADGALRGFVNLFVNGEDIRMLERGNTPVSDGDELEIVPALAGGTTGKEFSAWRSELRAAIREIDPIDVARALADDAVLLDVRGVDEWRQGHLPGATHLDRGFLEARIATVIPDRTAPIICYCESGSRSLFAAATLTAMGYLAVASLAGGVQGWKAAGNPIVRPDVVDEAAQRRYLRHLSMPEVGPDGQRKLGAARVLIVGGGGLGCPAALYLAAAGVGRLGVVDDDVVEESNLQRQILYSPAVLGRSKAEGAATALSAFNPFITVDTYVERLGPARALELFEAYDVIVDATDNFKSRYLINDAAVARGKPVVHGAVYRFDGQVSVFGIEDGPCYRCFSPEAPPPELAPSCAEGGVLGVLPGVVGLLMATEVIKLIIGAGEPLSGRLVQYDGLGARFRELRFRQRPDCAACGLSPRLKAMSA